MQKKPFIFSYKETMDYIESIQGFGSVLGLESITELCRRLGNPQEELCFVHIAGTNAKGSVLAFISSILKSAGYKTGRYISPVIFDYRERIQVNGQPISKAGLCRHIMRIKEVCGEMVREGLAHPTPFEVETAAGFLYFKEKKCDIVVLETGMGGLTDATNVVTKTLVAVLTPISMDHMEFLGGSLAEIAGVKAGIIKPGCRVVSAVQPPPVQKVIEQVCAQNGVSLQFAGEKEVTKIKSGLEKQVFSYKNREKLCIHLVGRYQISNAILAIEAIEALKACGFTISDAALAEGLSQTVWAGRFSIIGKKPLFIVDGAHNPGAAVKLRESIEIYFKNTKKIFIIGMLKDKECDKIIKDTYFLADSIVTVKPPGNSRAMEAYELARQAAVYHNQVTVADSLEEAVEISYLLAGKDTVIIAFGSLSYLGALTGIVRNKNSIRRDSHGR